MRGIAGDAEQRGEARAEHQMQAGSGRRIGNGTAGDAGGQHEGSKTVGTAHCSITRIAITPAAGSAQSAASARHAMATVAAASSVKTVSAALS